MMQNEVARKYSQALFNLGKEKEQLVEFKDELNRVWEIITENEDLKNTFFHHRILPGDKKKIIKELFSEQLSESIFNYLNLLIDKRREYFLESIVSIFNRLVNKEVGIVEVEVVSAVELNGDLKQKLREKLTQLLDSRITIRDRCDPDIIGGMILKIGDYIIDGSIKNRLDSLKSRIKQIPVSELGV